MARLAAQRAVTSPRALYCCGLRRPPSRACCAWPSSRAQPHQLGDAAANHRPLVDRVYRRQPGLRCRFIRRIHPRQRAQSRIPARDYRPLRSLHVPEASKSVLTAGGCARPVGDRPTSCARCDVATYTVTCKIHHDVNTADKPRPCAPVCDMDVRVELSPALRRRQKSARHERVDSDAALHRND